MQHALAEQAEPGAAVRAPDHLAATALLREVRERGYAGGYSILKKHLARLRPVAPPDPVVRF